MGNLFGSSKKSRVTELDRAVLSLKKQRDDLKRAQRRMEVWKLSYVSEFYFYFFVKNRLKKKR